MDSGSHQDREKYLKIKYLQTKTAVQPCYPVTLAAETASESDHEMILVPSWSSPACTQSPYLIELDLRP